MHNFSQPHPDALALSEQLTQRINEEIQAANGLLSFSRFMDLCLYTPQLGYYVTGLEKLGPRGDFITAPELSPLFSQCIARQSQQILEMLGTAEILELGAGSGKMASDILLYLELQQSLPQRYSILEISPDLRQRQYQTLKERCPHLLEKVSWLSELPVTPFRGVILANEVIDAMPVHRFATINNTLQEYFVTLEDENYQWKLAPITNNHLLNTIAQLKKNNFDQVEQYSSEINVWMNDWIKSLSQILQQGLLLIIDYGFPEHEYYHPQRSMGTLMCHYQHRAHDNPLLFPGLQDITAHVNFTQLANSAEAVKLDILGYNTQAFFLLSCGIQQLIPTTTLQENILANQAVKRLTLPHEMGELFKVMALGRGIEQSLLGFELQDLRGRL